MRRFELLQVIVELARQGFTYGGQASESLVSVENQAKLALGISAFFVDSCGKMSERSGFSGCVHVTFREVGE